MSELALLAESVGTSERTLRRAVNQGALHAERPTPRTLTLPLTERRYVRRSWKLLGSLRRLLRTERNVRLAVLVGSAARGDDTPASDIDLIVDLGASELGRVLDLQGRLATAVGRPVDLVRLEDAEGDPSFLADALAEGRVLVDREGTWPRLRARDGESLRHGRGSESERVRSALDGIDRLLAG